MARILIIDDDVDYTLYTSTILSNAGHEILTAFNGEDGYHKALELKPSLIILDAMMAYETDGFDTARKLREDPATKVIPVIMITGIRLAQGLTSMPAPHERWLPVDRILEKPVKPEELLQCIEATISV